VRLATANPQGHLRILPNEGEESPSTFTPPDEPGVVIADLATVPQVTVVCSEGA